MSKLKIFLKSGQTIEVECEEWDFSYDKVTLDYNGYTFKGFKNIKSMGLVPSQIAGYIELK